MRPVPRSAHGFSLVEMAVVLVILGLLLSGLLMTLTSQQAAQKVLEAERAEQQIREALLGFAAIHGRLPCPADPALPDTNANAGVERAPTAVGCTGGDAGSLPWATLGLRQLDAWNWRYTYRVGPLFSRTVIARAPGQYGCAVPPPAAPARSAFALCSPGPYEVRASAGGTALATGLPALFVSHGPNGFRARRADGGLNGASGDADEQENADADAIHVDRSPTETFDDRVEWIAAPVLMNRMLQAGRLP